MVALTHADLTAEGQIFYQQRNGRNCKMKLVLVPLESEGMVAQQRRTQWRWKAIEVDAPDDVEVKPANYLVTSGYEEHAPAIFDSMSDLPEEEKQERKQITLTAEDLKKLMAGEPFDIDLQDGVDEGKVNDTP